MMRAQRARQPEAGFAMLVVFLLAAFVAISLYMELPRVVFESQRNREQTLIDRGEQYRRAIQLYYRAFQRYPPDMDALENTNNRHFLRHRYKDPMTDKDEWRLIHAVAPGVFSDSLVYKPPNQKEKDDESATTAPAENAPAAPWMQRRPSDMTLPPGQDQGAAPGMYDATGAEAMAGQPVTGDPSTAPAQPQRPPGFPPMIATGQMYPGQPGSTPGQQPGVPPGVGIQAPVAGGPPVPFGQFPGQAGQIVPTQIQPGMAAPGQAGPSGAPGQSSSTGNPALDIIRTILTTPNPRGVSGASSASSPQPGGPPLLAGVASNLEEDSIKVYNDRTKYNEWEFIYDPRQDKTALMRMPGVQPGPVQQTGPAPGVAVPPGSAPTVPGSVSPQAPFGSPIGFPPMGPGGGMPQPQRPGRGR